MAREPTDNICDGSLKIRTIPFRIWCPTRRPTLSSSFRSLHCTHSLQTLRPIPRRRHSLHILCRRRSHTSFLYIASLQHAHPPKQVHIAQRRVRVVGTPLGTVKNRAYAL